MGRAVDLLRRHRSSGSSLSSLSRGGPQWTPTTEGDPNYLTRYTDSQAQVPSAYAERRLHDVQQDAARTLELYGPDLTDDEIDKLAEIAKTGQEPQEGWFMKLLEMFDKPGELVRMGIADILGIDEQVGAEIELGDYWNSFIGREEPLREKFGDLAYTEGSTFGFLGENLLETGDLLTDHTVWRAIIGFALDVGLDPLTYMSWGSLGLGKVAATRAGMKTVKHASEKVGKALAEATVERGLTKVSKALSTGKKLGALTEPFEMELGRRITTKAKSLSDDIFAQQKAEFKKLVSETAGPATRGKDLSTADLKMLKAFADRKGLEEATTIVRREVSGEIEKLTINKQFATLREKFPDYIHYSQTHPMQTGGLKLTLPLARKKLGSRFTVDLGHATDRAASRPVRTFIDTVMDKMPQSVRDMVDDLDLRWGREKPFVRAAKEGRAWALDELQTMAREAIEKMGVKGAPQEFSHLLRELRNMAGDQADLVEERLASLADTPFGVKALEDPQALTERVFEVVARELDAPLAHAVAETHTKVRELLERLLQVYRRFDPDIGELDGYFPTVAKDEFLDVVEVLAAKGVRITDDVLLSVDDAELRLGLSLLSEYTSRVARRGGQRAKDVEAMRFANQRSVGKTVFMPIPDDVKFSLLSKQQLKTVWHLSDDATVGFFPKTEMNRAITRALDYLLEEQHLRIKLSKDFAPFETDIATVLDTYISAMTRSLEAKVQIQAAIALNLIRPQDKRFAVGSTLAHVIDQMGPVERRLVDSMCDFAERRRSTALGKLSTVKTTTVHILGGGKKAGPSWSVEVPEIIASSPRFQKTVATLKKKAERALQRSNDIIAQQVTKEKDLVRRGLPENIAHEVATATTDEVLKGLTVAIEAEGIFIGQRLMATAAALLEHAEDSAARALAFEALGEAQKEVTRLARQARNAVKKARSSWADNFTERQMYVNGKVDLAAKASEEATQPILAELGVAMSRAVDELWDSLYLANFDDLPATVQDLIVADRAMTADARRTIMKAYQADAPAFEEQVFGFWRNQTELTDLFEVSVDQVLEHVDPRDVAELLQAIGGRSGAKRWAQEGRISSGRMWLGKGKLKKISYADLDFIPDDKGWRVAIPQEVRGALSEYEAVLRNIDEASVTRAVDKANVFPQVVEVHAGLTVSYGLIPSKGARTQWFESLDEAVFARELLDSAPMVRVDPNELLRRMESGESLQDIVGLAPELRGVADEAAEAAARASDEMTTIQAGAQTFDGSRYLAEFPDVDLQGLYGAAEERILKKLRVPLDEAGIETMRASDEFRDMVDDQMWEILDKGKYPKRAAEPDLIPEVDPLVIRAQQVAEHEKVRLREKAATAVSHWARENDLNFQGLGEKFVPYTMSDPLFEAFDPVFAVARMAGFPNASFDDMMEIQYTSRFFHEYATQSAQWHAGGVERMFQEGIMGDINQSQLMGAMVQGNVPKLMAHQAEWGRMMERYLGLSADNLSFVQGTDGAWHVIYDYAAGRTIPNPSLDDVLKELAELFPETAHLGTRDTLNLWSHLARITDRADEMSEGTRHMLDEIAATGDVGQAIHTIDAIDSWMHELFDFRQGLRQGRVDLQKAGREYAALLGGWTQVHRRLEAVYRGKGSIGMLRRTIKAHQRVLKRHLPARLWSELNYTVDYLEAAKKATIPQAMLERNRNVWSKLWDDVSAGTEALEQFANTEYVNRIISEVGQADDLQKAMEDFRELFAKLLEHANRGDMLDRGVSSSYHHLGALAPGVDEAKEVFEATKEAGLEAARAIREVADQPKEARYLLEELAEHLRAKGLKPEDYLLPIDATDTQVRHWLEAKADRMGRHWQTINAPVAETEGFLAPQVVAVGGEHLDGMLADRWVAAHLENLVNNMRALYSPLGMRLLGENYRSALGWWKTAVTVGRPTFSPRNLLGGCWNAWALEVGPAHYAFVGHHAAKLRYLTRSKGMRIDDAIRLLPEKVRPYFEAAIDTDLFNTAFSRDMERVLSGQKPWVAMQSLNPTNTTRFAPFRAGAWAMETTEDFLRMAVFVKFFDPANPQSRWWARDMSILAHFDYQNLTELERRIKTLIPFFVWTRRNVPLQAQLLMERPGMINKYQHLATNMDSAFQDEMADQFPIAGWHSGLTIRTGWVVGKDTPFWSRIILDPDLPFNDIEGALQSIQEEGMVGGSIKILAQMLSPGFTAPFDVAATGDFGDVNAPAGLHSILLGMHEAGLWDNVSQTGDPRITYQQRQLLEMVNPWLAEWLSMTSLNTDPKRKGKAGITADDGLSFGERLGAIPFTLGRGWGLRLQTPADTPGETWEAQQAIDEIMERAEMQGRIVVPAHQP